MRRGRHKWLQTVNAVPLTLLFLTAGTPIQGQVRSEQYGMGAIPPPVEIYDAAPRQAMYRAAVPVSVDLSRFAPKPENQGGQQSCAAWATTYAARTILGTLGGSAKEATFSPALTYNLGLRHQAQKYPQVKSDCESGMMIPVALDLLKDTGALPFSQFPYDATNCNRLPTTTEGQNASRARIGDWQTLETRDAVRQALAQSRPVVFAMPVGPTFMRWSGSSLYDLRAKLPGDGYHAMTIVGYDDEKGAFRVINSWGADWGDGGYFWLSYPAFDALVPYAGRLQAFAVIPVAAAAKPVAPPVDATDPDLGLTAIRNTLTCGDIVWEKQGTRYSVKGYVGSTAERTAVTNAILRISPGAAISLDMLPWPQCEVRRRLTSFALGVPVALTANNKTVEPGPNGVAELRQGDFFTLATGLSPSTRHLTLVYIQADGTAVPLYDGAPSGGATGPRSIELGTGESLFRVSGPLGPEAIVSIASDGPVFNNLPSSGVAERQFLDMLNRHLIETTQKGRPIRVASLLLNTRPQ